MSFRGLFASYVYSNVNGQERSEGELIETENNKIINHKYARVENGKMLMNDNGNIVEKITDEYKKLELNDDVINKRKRLN